MIRRCLLALLLLQMYSYAVGVELTPKAQLTAFNSAFPSDAPQRLPGAANTNELLPADEAFKMSVVILDPQTIAAEFVPASGYYLYRDKFEVRVQEPTDVKVTSIELPRGEIKDDPFFGKTEVFHNKVQVLVRLQRVRAVPIVLDMAYQGCNERIGVCYLPIEKRIRLELPAPTNLR